MAKYYLDEEGLRKFNQLLQAKFLGSGTGGVTLLPGDNIEIVNNIISVITTNDIDGDNTKPITSSAVYTTVGNIQELLKTI